MWVRLAIGCAVLLAVAPLAMAQTAPTWPPAAGGANLVRPVFWEGLDGVSADGGQVTVTGPDQSSFVNGPVIDRYGPRLHATGDFAITATLQTADADLATLAIVDAVTPDQWGPAMRRVEVGLEQGEVVFGIFDGTSSEASAWQTFATDNGGGPIAVGVYREGDSVALQVSGAEVARVPVASVFQTGAVLIGTRVTPGNQLTLSSLDVLAPTSSSVSIDRCTPTRLLAGGADADEHNGLWWIWPDDGVVRRIDAGTTGATYLVAVSPDQRWVAYYQGPVNYDPARDRFVVDTWVMDLENDEHYKLVDGNTPIGWISDSSAVVLGERPMFMALVPSGEVVPSQGQLIYAQSMRSATSPDSKWRARVESTPQGAAGIAILDAASGAEVWNIRTGRGAPQLAWSPDSARLAYTSGNDSDAGLIWKLRVATLAGQSASVLGSTQDLFLHSVIWPPPLPGCP